MLRPLIIDKAKVKALVDHAMKKPYSMDDLLDIHNGDAPPPGDFPEFVLDIPIGYRVVYTIEEQPAGKVRHLSVSVDTINSLPNPLAVQEIMTEFGFENELEDCLVNMEPIAPNHQAISIQEIIKT